jgi:hypothetical protein
MATSRTFLAVAAVVALFMLLVAAIIALLALKQISFPLAMLMLIALLGIYVGCGVLVAVWRFVSRLQ